MPKIQALQPHNIDFADGTDPIIVNYKDARKYYKCKSYDGNIGLNWIEFYVHHGGTLNYSPNPQQLILNGLYDAIDGEEFYPVNYEAGSQIDVFLARACKPALDKLFKRCLTIKISTGNNFNLTVWVNAAVYNRNQISPAVVISKVISSPGWD